MKLLVALVVLVVLGSPPPSKLTCVRDEISVAQIVEAWSAATGRTITIHSTAEHDVAAKLYFSETLLVPEGLTDRVLQSVLLARQLVLVDGGDEGWIVCRHRGVEHSGGSAVELHPDELEAWEDRPAVWVRVELEMKNTDVRTLSNSVSIMSGGVDLEVIEDGTFTLTGPARRVTELVELFRETERKGG